MSGRASVLLQVKNTPMKITSCLLLNSNQSIGGFVFPDLALFDYPFLH
jgi:hypothetical protein